MAKDIQWMGAIFPDVPSITLPQQGGGLVSFDDTSDGDIQPADVASGKIGYAQGQRVVGTAVAPSGSQTFTENGTYNVASIAEAVINVAGGGGGGFGTLLATQYLGSLNTLVTTETILDQKVIVSGINSYDLLIVATSGILPPSGTYLMATVCVIALSNSSGIDTKTTYRCMNQMLNFKRDNGILKSRSNSNSYGVYPTSSASISDGTITLTMATKYSSAQTGTIEGDYTTRVYGVSLYDLIGG